ncbi:MAG TPA: hypothetical protein VHB25_08610 [Gemmatimonadaceae bacterium]|nr:hypothetical protein [Gemmatimonadaceae bacterium]
MTRRAARALSVSSVLLATLLFVAITAAEGANVIAVPLPSAATVIETFALALVGEMIRRVLKKLDRVGEKCDATHEAFGKFETRIQTAIFDRGALIDEVRDLQSTVYRDEPPAAPPPGFTIAPRGTPAKATS